MDMPFWMSPRPVHTATPSDLATVDQLLHRCATSAGATEIRLPPEIPRWWFLCQIGDRRSMVLHGSNDGTIEEFEPRQAHDVSEFGARRAVYASTDGIWPLFFAVIDRARYRGMLINSSVELGNPPIHGYFFSLDRVQLTAGPWCPGWVYLLPPDTFETERLDDDDQGRPVVSSQCASTERVRPIARLRVVPADFPFLDEVHGHDPEEIVRRSEADPSGFPWVRAEELSQARLKA